MSVYYACQGSGHNPMPCGICWAYIDQGIHWSLEGFFLPGNHWPYFLRVSQTGIGAWWCEVLSTLKWSCENVSLVLRRTAYFVTEARTCTRGSDSLLHYVRPSVPVMPCPGVGCWLWGLNLCIEKQEPLLRELKRPPLLAVVLLGSPTAMCPSQPYRGHGQLAVSVWVTFLSDMM